VDGLVGAFDLVLVLTGVGNFAVDCRQGKVIPRD